MCDLDVYVFMPFFFVKTPTKEIIEMPKPS